MLHIENARRAANATPETNLPAIEAFVESRLEHFIRSHDIPSQFIDAIRSAYLAGMHDANIRVGELLEVEA